MTEKLKILGPYRPNHDGPFCTRNGLPVRILTKTEGSSDLPVVGLIEGERTPCCWTDMGRFDIGASDEATDLMCAVEVQQPREFWIVGSTAYSTHAAAYEALDILGRLKIIHVREVLPGEGE